MHCENIFCMYQDDSLNTCSLEHITLDSTGTCEDCVYVHIKKKDLKDLKDLLLNKLDNSI